MSEIQQWIEKHKPYCYFHPDETHFPCSAEFYCANSRLYQTTGPNSEKMILDVGQVYIDSLANYNDSTYDLKSIPESWNGEGTTTAQLSTVPYYCHYVDFGSYYDFQYVFLYMYNGAFSLFSCGGCCDPLKCLPCAYVGSHIHDLEHITVRVNKETGKIIKVHFGAHQAKDGMWKDASNLHFYDGTHVRVYIAKGSHATYPAKGCWLRIFCAVNDYTFDQGIIWYPQIPIPIINNAMWNLWKGSYDESDTPARHDWYPVEEKASTNFFKRLCCPCLDANNDCLKLC